MNIKKVGIVIGIIICLIISIFACIGCESDTIQKSTSGVNQAQTKVKTQASGYTVEQENIIDRLSMDNKVGSIKHLYIISAYTGQALIYSTVKGKVTSSGKRLAPLTINANTGYGIPVDVNGVVRHTSEMIQDDGTYGNSIHYLYWWDSKGVYHQHYVSGGQIIHISDQPLIVPEIIINMELTE